MPSFQVVDNSGCVQLPDTWTDSEKFNSANRIVGKNGKLVTSNYEGNLYKLISKKERDFTTVERIGRGFLGIVAVICSLCMALLFKSIRNLFTQDKEKIRFGEVVYISSHEFLKSNRVDIAKEASRFFFQDQQVSEKLYKLIDEKVHRYMTARGVVCDHIKHIQNKGFEFLGDRILEHPEFDGWIMKGGGDIRLSWVGNKAGKAEPNRYDNILRVFMAERMSKVTQEEKLDIEIPEKRLLPSKFKSAPGKFHKKYYVFSRKIEILDESTTKSVLHGLPQKRQRKIARDVCLLIKRTGFMDAHFGNIRWNPSSEKLAIFDTESQGLLIEKTDKSPRFKGTIKKCALIGLQELKDRIGIEFPIFAKEADKAMSEL